MIVKVLLVLTWIYIIFGIIGIFRFKDMYARLLTSSKIDTVAALTLIIALMIYSGFNGFTLRLLLILIFIMMTNPVNNHIITRSAYLNGIRSDDEDEEED